MDTLGEDLVLLSIEPGSGRVVTSQRIGYALMGSELVRLAAYGRVCIDRDRVVVQSAAPGGDAELDAALASLASASSPPRARLWVGRPRRHILDAYLDRLARTGVLRGEGHAGLLGSSMRWRAVDTRRQADAFSRLDAIARSAGPVGQAQEAFAGLAYACGLGTVLYPGWGNRGVRRRLAEIAKGQWSARAIGRAVGADAVRRTAAEAASESVNEAAVNAAVAAATAAATAAAVSAAHTAGHSGGGSGGHHGGAVGHH